MALKAGYVGVKRFIYERLQKNMVAANNEISTIKKVANINSGHNYLPTFPDKTASTLTIDTDADGVVDVDGTAASFSVNVSVDFKLPAGKYHISGVPAGMGDNKMILKLDNLTASSEITRDRGAGADFTLTAETSCRCYLYVYQSYGDYDHIKVYPMISVQGDNIDYAPYAMSNRQLTAEAATLESVDDAHKTTINGIISAATGAADFAAFKTAMAALTPLTRSAAPDTREASPEVIEEDPEPVTRKSSKKTTTKEGE